MLSIACTNEEKVKISVSPVTATGRPASIDGAIRVFVQAGEATVVPVDDYSVYLVSGDNPGVSQFLVQADADLGEGVVLLEDAVELVVSGAQAAALGLFASPPELK